MRQPFSGGRRQHLFRILQHTGSTHDPASRNIDAHVETPEVVVELGRAQVHAVVPPSQVIELRHTREPLCRLKQGIVPSLGHAMPLSVRSTGELRVPCHLDRSRRLTGDGSRQRDARHRLVHPVGGQLAWGLPPTPGWRIQVYVLAVDRKARNDDTLGVLGRYRRTSGNQPPQDVVIQPQHDLAHLDRTVVVHLDCPGPGDRVSRRVQARLDRVVRFELPIVRSRTPRKVTGARLEGAADNIRKRYVATDGSIGRVVSPAKQFGNPGGRGSRYGLSRDRNRARQKRTQQAQGEDGTDYHLEFSPTFRQGHTS